MTKDLDYRTIKDYAKGVFLSDEFKDQTEDVPTISEYGDPDIYFDEIDKISSKNWLFAMTLISDHPNPLMMPLSSLDRAFDEDGGYKLRFTNGFIRKIPDQDHSAATEPTFTIGFSYHDPVTMDVVVNDAGIISDVFIASLLLDSNIKGGLDTVIHSARVLTLNEFERAEEGLLDLRRIKQSLPLKELAGHVFHVVENGIDSDFQLLEKTFGFLNKSGLEEKHQKIKTSYGMTTDGIKARTKEQGYLTLYTALNYMIEDVGRQSRSAKSEAQMALKMADEGVISTRTGMEVIEELNTIHETRSNILWGAETIDDNDFEIIQDFLHEYLLLYFDYWIAQSESQNSMSH